MDKLNQEILAISELMEKNADKGMKPILQAYKQALDDIRTEIAKLYVKYSDDGQLSISKSQRYTILKQLEKKLVEQARQLGFIDLEHTTKILKDVYSESYYRTAFAIDKGVSVDMSFALVTPEAVKAAVNTPIEGTMFSDRIWKNKNLLVNRLIQEIERGMIQGVSVDKLSRAIKKEFDVSAYESKRLIHTELARVQSEASASIYKKSSVIKQVMFDATLDSKTSKICSSLDGKMFDADSDYPKPGRNTHPNCRSAIVPVIDGWSPSKKRENIKNEDSVKPIIDYSNYESWKKSKGIN